MSILLNLRVKRIRLQNIINNAKQEIIRTPSLIPCIDQAERELLCLDIDIQRLSITSDIFSSHENALNTVYFFMHGSQALNGASVISSMLLYRDVLPITNLDSQINY